MKLTNNLSIDKLMQTYESQGFSLFQLRQIKDGLLHGLDVSIYAKKVYSYRLMHLAVYLLKANINIEQCVTNDKLDVGMLLETYQRSVFQGKTKSLNSFDLMLVEQYPYED